MILARTIRFNVNYPDVYKHKQISIVMVWLLLVWVSFSLFQTLIISRSQYHWTWKLEYTVWDSPWMVGLMYWFIAHGSDVGSLTVTIHWWIRSSHLCIYWSVVDMFLNCCLTPKILMLNWMTIQIETRNRVGKESWSICQKVLSMLKHFRSLWVISIAIKCKIANK